METELVGQGARECSVPFEGGFFVVVVGDYSKLCGLPTGHLCYLNMCRVPLNLI